MAGSKSDYLENAVLKMVFNNGGATGTAGGTNVGLGTMAQVQVVLLTAESADGTTLTKFDAAGGTYATNAGAGYAAQTVYSNGNVWTLNAATGTAQNQASNAGAITFGPITWTGGASITVTGVAIYDGSGTNLLYWADLSVAKTLTSGDSLSFAAGQLIISED